MDWYFAHSGKEDSLELGFWGGEVLSTFDILQHLVNYANGKFKDRLRRIEFTTNGTLLSRTVAEWIKSNEKVSIAVTLNGPRTLHDQRRVFCSGQGTFDVIMRNVKTLKSVMGAEGFSARVTFLANFDSDREHREILRYFRENELLRDSHVTCIRIHHPDNKERNWKEVVQDRCEILARQRRFVENFTSIQLDPRDYCINTRCLALIHYRGSGICEPVPFAGGCIPGMDRLMVDLDGWLRFCESGEGIPPLGNINYAENECGSWDVFDRLEQVLNQELHCPRCPAVRFCSICYREFFDQGGLRPIADLRRNCVGMRLRFKSELETYVSIVEKDPTCLQVSREDVPRCNEELSRRIKETLMRKSTS